MMIKNLITRTAIALCALCFVQLTTFSALAQATVTTDKEDYAPYSVVWITGTGFAPGETVSNVVVQIAGPAPGAVYDGWEVVADTNGNFETEWLVFSDDFIGTTLQLTSTGESSGLSAQATFKDTTTDLPLRSDLTVAINGGTSTKTLTGGAYGNSVTADTFTGTGSKTFDFYSPILTAPQALASGDKGAGVIWFRNTGAANLTLTGAATFYDYNPADGSQIQIVTTGATGNQTINTGGADKQVTLPNSANIGGSGYTVPVGHQLKVTITLNVSAGASGALLYNGAATTTGDSIAQLPQNRTIPWPFASFTTTTALSSSANPSLFGQSVTFTANVSSPNGTPTGTVTFKEGATTLGTGTLTGGTATFSIGSLSVATHSITAVYSGDSNFGTSTSSALSQVVNQASTTTALSSSVNPSVFGQSVIFTATVSAVAPGIGTRTGIVTFMDGATSLGTGTVNASGVATFTSSSLSVATHSITAVYGGDGNFTGSTSSAVSQVVNQAGTTTTLVSSDLNAVFSESVTFTATVNAVSPGAGTRTGTVTFMDGATTLGTGTLSGGTATFTTSSLSVGTHSITAVYGGDSNFNGSTSSSISEVVAKDNTTTVVTSSDANSVFGQSVTFTATVTAASPGTAIPAGIVTVKDGSTTLGTGTLNGSGQATFTTSSLSVANHTISAVYGGDSGFNTSTSGNLTQAVAKDTTTATVSSSVNPSVFSQSVTFTATVTADSPGSGTPTGNVTFKDGATTLTTVALSGGTATYSSSALAVGSHSITVVYAGDSSFTADTSAALSQVVNTADSSTALTSSANPSVSGQSITFTATVTAVPPGAGTPTGTVTFKDGATSIGTGTLNGSGVATLTTTTLSVSGSPHSITAVYAGDSSFSTSTSSAVSQTVNPDSTAVALSSSANPSVSGQMVTFTATVSAAAPGSGTPAGTVTFMDGLTTLGTGTLSGGTATFATSALSVSGSPHSITAAYGGDSNFAGSTSSAVNQTVNPASTSTALTSTDTTPVFGQSVTFTATVTATAPGSGTPTGTVTFKDGTTAIGTGTLSGGSATFTTSSFTVATHSITAVYGGDGNFNTSTSSAVTETVSKASTTTALTSSDNPSVYSETVTITATVSVSSPGSGTPTGTVTFKDGTTVVGTGTLSGGIATFTSSSLAVATHNFTASYGGDGTFNNSNSGTLSQVVNKDNTGTALTSSANPSAFGQSVTFTATVTAAAPATATPTGTVTFKDGATTLGTGTLNGSGVATFATAALSASGSPHSITAVYGGDGNCNTSTSSALSQTVNTAGTTTALASSANPSVFGQSVTFTATVSVTAPGSGTPSGTVTFKDGATTLGTGTLSAGTATFTTSALSVSGLPHSITAVYGGDSSFNTSTSSAVSQTVNQDGTSTSLASSANPSVSGQSVTFTATVSATAPGSGTPTGTVTFKDGATTLGTGTLSGATATFAIASLSVATHSITAVYGGDGNFNGSTSSALSQVVNQDGTATALTSSANPSVFNQSVTFTATVGAVAPGSGTPTGTVTFKDGASTLGTGTLNGSGQATFTTSSLSVGSHSITALYGGDGNFNTSTSSALSQTVNPGPATTLVVSGFPSPQTAGVQASFTVTAKDQFGNTATGYRGTVHFTSSDSQATLPGNYTFVAGDNGVRSFNATLKTAGTESITATDTVTGSINGTQSGIVINAATATQILVETAPDGSGTVVPAQNVSSGSSVVGYAITRDAFNNFVSNSAATWTLQNITGSVVSGDLVPSGDTKSATFTGHFTGSARIQAASGTLTKTLSGILTVVAGAPAQLAFGTQPSDTFFGEAIAPAVTVQILDQAGNLTTSSASVTVAIGNNPAAGSLSGTTTVAASAGTASFSNLSIDAPGFGYTLTASSAGLTGATSSSFKVYQGAWIGGVEDLTDNTTTTSETVTPTKNTINGAGLLILIYRQATADPDSVTSITGPFIGTPVLINRTNFLSKYNVWAYRAIGNGTSGNVTVNFAQGNKTTVIDLLQLSSANAIVQSSANAGLSATASASLVSPNPNNTEIMYIGIAGDKTVTTPSGFAVIMTTDGGDSGGFGTWDGSAGSAVASVSATLSGSDNWGTIAIEIGLPSTTTTVTSSQNPSTYGTAINFTATVAPVLGTATPTGSVQFQTNGVNFGAPVLLSGGSATSATISTLAVGSYTVTANYTDGTAFAPSSGILTQTVNQKTLTPAVTVNDKVYDGTTGATIATRFLSGVVGTDDVNLDSSGTATFANKNVGTGKTVTITGLALSGTTAANYVLSSTTTTATADITARALTVTAAGVNKVYDGTTTATVTLSDNRVSGDVFTDSYTSATFANKNVGTGKTVSVSGISISGTDAGNYTFNTTASTTANITARTLTVTATGVNKVYDGNATATVTLSDDKVAGDAVTDNYTSATFNNKNVGTAKPVSVSGISISGTDASNYSLANTTASTTADITARALTISATGVDKVYDGTAAATVTLGDNRVSGDVFTDSYTTASFNDKNVGTAKPVSVSGISISGTDAGNYTFNTTASTTADITARALTISATGVNKVYDGTTAATVTLGDDRLSGDVFTDSYTSAAFSDKNVGAGKSVSVSGISISGTDAGNYTFNTTASTTADITARALTISATGVNKTYDGTAAATVTLSDNRVSGDVFTDSYTSATFADKNVGTGKSVSVSGISISGTDAGNYTFNTTASTTANITARTLTISATGVNKVYDGNTTATVTLSDDRVSGDAVTDSYTSASFDTKNVGTGKTVSVSGITISGTDAGNYTFNTTASTTADITARALLVSATGVNKVYDGNTTATVTLSDDRVSGDLFTDSYTSATFADKNVGTAKPVSVSGTSISGTDAGNYTFNTTASTTANITPRALTISATGVNKVYDGNTTATVTLSDNRVSGDVFTDSYTSASFLDKNVGSGKAVSVSGISISGTDAGNYTFNTTASTTADITARALIITAHGVNKVYDSTTTATVTLTDDRVSGDVFTDSYTTATFADKNVGTGKTVSVSGISISGTDAGNYTFNTTASTTADITARALTISATGVNKVYDGNPTAAVNLSDDRVSGDVFTDTYTSAAFVNKNVGTAKTVNVSGISISGTDAGNYTFNTTASTTADITQRALTVSATGVNKVYDGTAAATVTLSDNRVSGDVFTDSYTSAAFVNKNVGTAKTVNVSGILISGADAGNYTFNTAASTTADITQRVLAITATGHNKVYDGTTAATVTLSDNRVSGDVFTDSYTSATFSDKTVGTGKTVTVTGISISGADAGNYSFNTSTTTTADITGRVLTITATGVNKVYDGTTSATVTLSDNREAGDDITTAYTSATFDTKNVGTGKTVSVSGISISGTDAGNYTFNTTASTTANITQRALTVTATGVNKVYDGTVNATVTFSTDKLSGDDVTASGSASFADKSVGTGKTVSVTGITIGGADAGNYNLLNTTASTTASITARPLTVTATGVNKVYDGTTAATVTLSDNKVSADAVTETYTSASFADKNVATGKPVSVSGISISGADAGNYSFNTTATTTADITQRALTVSATGVNKVYDGNATATVTLSDDRVSGDLFTDSYTSAAFVNKNVGTGKTVSVSGISISGTDAGNYTFNTTASTTADITARALTVSATGVNKDYDGNTTATVTLSDNRVSGDAFTDSYTTATFADKNVGTGKAVSVSGISISGTDAGNYTFNTTASTTANITQRALTVTATGVNKAYDGTTAATVTLSDNRVAGDVFADSYTSASFADANVGNNKPVSVSGILISGTDAGNYTFNTTASTTANITPAGTSTTVASSLNPANYTDSVTFTATVTSSAGTPTGTVLFYDGANLLGSGSLNGAGQATFTTTTLSVGSHSITAVYGGAGNFGGSTSAILTQVINNSIAPVVTITAPASASVYAVNTSVSFTGNFSSSCTAQSAQWKFDTITKAVTVSGTSGSLNTTYTFTSAGVYMVTLSVTDTCGNTGSSSTVSPSGDPAMIVIYDPNGGFVTGGGWIMSPAGAFPVAPSLTGKANFGFVSKYLKGATVPTGETEFQFQVANMKFHSASYEWLVVSGAMAQYKGVGTINNAGNYGFILTAVDGQITGGGGTDKFRIKIWDNTLPSTDPNYIVYDNMIGSADGSAPTTVIGGGSISIKTK